MTHPGDRGDSTQIQEEPKADFFAYACIPIGFKVNAVMDVSRQNGQSGGFGLTERKVSNPYWKDYDAFPGNHPSDWPRTFDVANWGMLSAKTDSTAVGGAIVAIRTPGLHLLERRDDLAVLWDIRVAPDWRGRGIGAMLFEAAAVWAKRRGCHTLKIETQNVNAPACLFYARQGCELVSVNPLAYPTLPDEIQLIWQKKI